MMNKTLHVLRYELVTTLNRRSFLVVALAIPLLAIVLSAGVALVRGRSSGSGEAPVTAEAFQLAVEGYVDQSGLITTIPPDIPPGHLLPYPDEEHAKQALDAGEIARYAHLRGPGLADSPDVAAQFGGW
jgi:hypothetical protein